MTTILIATRNAHKVAEIRQILSGNLRCLSQNEVPGAPAAAEDADSFAGNARKKAEGLADWLAAHPDALPDTIDPESDPFYILADDSGLEVDALGGAPGVHSARFAAWDAPGAANAPDAANNARLLRLLDGVPPERRTARFRCVLALLRLRPLATPWKTVTLEGICEGRIAFAPAGTGGFGYDPLFVPEGWAQSLAELGEAVKNTLSHRARALEKLRLFLLDNGPAA
ncbi:MAG: non-canonical purine NTP pyrophosphatase [Verrucomicrobiota bacterium]|jgi:XTP/dITP diphosphohydrolase